MSPPRASRARGVGRIAPLVVLLVVLSVATSAALFLADQPAVPTGRAAAHTSASAIRPATVGPLHPWTCHGLRALSTPACGNAPSPSVPLSGGTSPGWRQVLANPPALSAYDFEMTYDAADGYVVLFGAVAGSSGSSAPTVLWTYSHGQWTNRTSSVIPQNCIGSVLAYDAADGYVVYFGGENLPYSWYDHCASANQTWTYHAGVWTQLNPATSPPGRLNPSFSNDSADGYLVLFGGTCYSGCDKNGYFGDTWKFVGGKWTQLSPTSSPSDRQEAGMAYDTADGYVVLFGGSNSTGNQNDTWKFVGGNWTKLQPAVSPPTPTPDAFAYDSGFQAVVYTTADNWSGSTPEITWSYSGGNWTHITSAGPVQRLGAGAADDPSDGYMLFFGGLQSQDIADTWGLGSGGWTNLTLGGVPGRYDAAATYDTTTHTVTLFGGIAYSGYNAVRLADTWSFANSTWTASNATGPSARSGAALVDDAADGYLLLFGGSGTTQSLNDTWEFAGGSWTQLTPTAAPPAGYPFSAVYDGADGYVLLLTGVPGHTWTWTFHAGTWTNRTSTVGTPPPGPASNPLAYDSSDGYVLLFGTEEWALTNYTFTFHGGKWSNATSTSGSAPPAASSASLVDFPPAGYVLLFEGSGGTSTWNYSHGTWSPIYSVLGPSPRSGVAAAYDALASVDVFFGGQGCGSGAYSLCAETWEWTSNGPVAPFIRSFGVAPASTDVGFAVNFTTLASGGAGPLTYAYSGLPPGCSSSNVSRLACRPTVVGTYSVEAVVTDSAGSTASASTLLVVHPAVAIASFSAFPSNVTLGATTIFRTNSSGGSPPLQYNYSGLPLGCAPQTVPALPCTPNSTGNFTVHVTVTDLAGATAVAVTVVHVTPVGATGGPLVYGYAAVPSAFVLGNSTNISLTARGGTSPYSYAYVLPPGCTSANASRIVCAPTSSGVYTITATVTDSGGRATAVDTNVTVYPAGGGAGLRISAFSASPGSVTVGTSTILTVVASGGRGPIGFLYSGLPPGCAAANSSLLLCTPAGAGTFSIHASVYDSAGDHAGVRTALAVIPGTGPGPSISSFVVSPAMVHLGQPITVVVALAAGSLPLNYSYTGLPTGCPGSNAAAFVCTPTQVGNFTVVVNVTDAFGRNAAASAHLEIRPPSAPPNPGTPGSATVGVWWATAAGEAGLGALGVLTGLALGAFLTWRRRRRKAGEVLVHALESSRIEPSAAEPGE